MVNNGVMAAFMEMWMILNNFIFKLRRFYPIPVVTFYGILFGFPKSPALASKYEWAVHFFARFPADTHFEEKPNARAGKITWPKGKQTLVVSGNMVIQKEFRGYYEKIMDSA